MAICLLGLDTFLFFCLLLSCLSFFDSCVRVSMAFGPDAKSAVELMSASAQESPYHNLPPRIFWSFVVDTTGMPLECWVMSLGVPVQLGEGRVTHLLPNHRS